MRCSSPLSLLASWQTLAAVLAVAMMNKRAAARAPRAQRRAPLVTPPTWSSVSGWIAHGDNVTQLMFWHDDESTRPFPRVPASTAKTTMNLKVRDEKSTPPPVDKVVFGGLLGCGGGAGDGGGRGGWGGGGWGIVKLTTWFVNGGAFSGGAFLCSRR